MLGIIPIRVLLAYFSTIEDLKAMLLLLAITE
jgi:hypothetical protein